MSGINLKKELQVLVGLQTIDSEIYKLRAEKNAAPEQLKAIEAEFEAKKQGLADLEKQSLDAQKLKKNKELELSAKEESIKKLQGQLFTLKTNKEYATMLGQINDAKADVSVIEDKILALMDQVDQIKADVEKEKLKLKDEEKVSSQKKSVIETRVKVIDDRLAQLEGQRKQIIPDIDAKVLAQYDRILVSRDGIAIVLVRDNNCLGCHMFVPAQVINLIKMYDRIMTCEVCNRILYIEDEAN